MPRPKKLKRRRKHPSCYHCVTRGLTPARPAVAFRKVAPRWRGLCSVCLAHQHFKYYHVWHPERRKSAPYVSAERRFATYCAQLPTENYSAQIQRTGIFADNYDEVRHQDAVERASITRRATFDRRMVCSEPGCDEPYPPKCTVPPLRRGLCEPHANALFGPIKRFGSHSYHPGPRRPVRADVAALIARVKRQYPRAVFRSRGEQ